MFHSFNLNLSFRTLSSKQAFIFNIGHIPYSICPGSASDIYRFLQHKRTCQLSCDCFYTCWGAVIGCNFPGSMCLQDSRTKKAMHIFCFHPTLMETDEQKRHHYRVVKIAILGGMPPWTQWGFLLSKDVWGCTVKKPKHPRLTLSS